MDPTELRQRAIELEADLWPDHAEDSRRAAEARRVRRLRAGATPSWRSSARQGRDTLGSGCSPTRSSVPRTSAADHLLLDVASLSKIGTFEKGCTASTGGRVGAPLGVRLPGCAAS